MYPALFCWGMPLGIKGVVKNIPVSGCLPGYN